MKPGFAIRGRKPVPISLCGGIAAIGLAIAIAGSSALGADQSPLPDYDVDRACAEGRSAGELAIKNCVRVEQRNYDALKAAWEELSEPGRLECLRAVRGARVYIYTGLRHCVGPVLRRERLLRTPPFQR